MNEIPLRLTGRHSSLRLDYAPDAPRADVGILPTALRGIVRRWWDRLRQRWRYAAALRELHALDSRTLQDIGLHRGNLHAVANAAARSGAFGRFGAVRTRRVGVADLPRCVQFGRLLHPEDIWRRFGRQAALGDGDTFRQLFGLDDGKIESIGAFDPSGALLGLATVAWLRPGTAEIALIVRSDLQRRGLGATLLADVIKSARGAGFRLIVAQIGTGNAPMRRLARRFGFELADNQNASAQAQLVVDR
jgi:GNAT superfamily N-acetyltransferase